MTYCPYCGCEVDDGVTTCPSCCSELETQTPTRITSSDKGGFGWSLLGCCLPLVALILYFVWHDSKPNTAKSLCTGAIVGVIIAVILLIAAFVLGFFAVGQLWELIAPYLPI